ncbi:MAG TPA: hypothetical protein VGL69_20190 [Solirubrobacteraceae bacterium]
MAASSVRVLVLGAGAGPGQGLVEALGTERAAAVRALLVRRAGEWAEGAFGAEAVELVTSGSFAAAFATDPAGPGGGAGPGGEAGPGGAAGPAGHTVGGPVVAIAPELPVWHPELAAAGLGDLQDGCALALAPIFDRGLYLLAIADPSADGMAALATLDLAGPGGMTDLIGLAQREGWEVGLLRAERGLRRERDVRALLADPLTDPELRALLE